AARPEAERSLRRGHRGRKGYQGAGPTAVGRPGLHRSRLAVARCTPAGASARPAAVPAHRAAARDNPGEVAAAPVHLKEVATVHLAAAGAEPDHRAAAAGAAPVRPAEVEAAGPGLPGAAEAPARWAVGPGTPAAAGAEPVRPAAVPAAAPDHPAEGAAPGHFAAAEAEPGHPGEARGVPDCWAAARAEEVAPDLRDCAAVPADQAIRSPGLARSFGSTFSSSRHVAAQRHWPYVSRITPVFSIMSAITPPRTCGYGRETPVITTITTRSRGGSRGWSSATKELTGREGGMYSPLANLTQVSVHQGAHHGVGQSTRARTTVSVSPPGRAPRCRPVAGRAGSGVRYPLRRVRLR